MTTNEQVNWNSAYATVTIPKRKPWEEAAYKKYGIHPARKKRQAKKNRKNVNQWLSKKFWRELISRRRKDMEDSIRYLEAKLQEIQ